MSRDLKRALDEAQQRFEASGYRDKDARAAVLAAEGRLAGSRGEPWAEVIDLGVRWSGGAPLPHLISNGTTAVVVCHAADADPNWDGTSTRMVSPSDREPSRLLRFTFDRCYSVKFGGPNDEALHGHPLDGRGLRTDHAHLVHNSAWIAQDRGINSVHDHHSDVEFQVLTHYLFSFHDETLEVLAGSVTVEAVATTVVELLLDTCRQLVSD